VQPEPQLIDTSLDRGAPAPEVRVIFNWFDELKRLGGK
jgi:hypothetical protein